MYIWQNSHLLEVALHVAVFWLVLVIENARQKYPKKHKYNQQKQYQYRNIVSLGIVLPYSYSYSQLAHHSFLFRCLAVFAPSFSHIKKFQHLHKNDKHPITKSFIFFITYDFQEHGVSSLLLCHLLLLILTFL